MLMRSTNGFIDLRKNDIDQDQCFFPQVNFKLNHYDFANTIYFQIMVFRRKYIYQKKKNIHFGWKKSCVR